MPHLMWNHYCISEGMYSDYREEWLVSLSILNQEDFDELVRKAIRAWYDKKEEWDYRPSVSKLVTEICLLDPRFLAVSAEITTHLEYDALRFAGGADQLPRAALAKTAALGLD